MGNLLGVLSAERAVARGSLHARAVSALLALLSAACERAPAVVHPLRPEALDSEVAGVVAEHLRAAEAQPRSAALHGELGLVYEANSLWPEARASFALARTLAPDEPSWGLHLAIATMQGGDFAAAVELLRELAAEAPEFAPARQRLGDALLETSELAAAAEHFRATLRLVPRSPEGHVGLGRVALAEQDYPRAVRQLERALRLDPRHALARFLLAQAYRRLGREGEAERLEAAPGGGAPRKGFLVDEAGVRAEGYAAGLLTQLTRARAALEDGQSEDALAILEPLAEAYPGRPDVLNNLAIAYASAGRVERAVERLQAACDADDSQAMNWATLAVAHLELGDTQAALACVDRSLALEPASSRAHYVRGSALLRAQRFEEARGALERAHALDRKDPNVRLALGEACWRLGELGAAEEHLRQAAARLPRSVPAQLLLARVLVTLDRLEEARGCVEQARSLSPEDREVLGVERLVARKDGQ